MRSPARPCVIHCTALLAGLLASAAAPEARADVEEWRLDPTHSRIVFDVEHAGFSYSMATLSKPTGRLLFDPESWEGASVEAEIPMASLDFGDEDWNDTMKGRGWFDIERFPVARFVSTLIEPIDEDEARVHGTLTVRDVSAPVTLDLRVNDVRRNPLTLRRTAGFSATATLDRRDFGMDRSANLIGQTVRVRLEIEAVRGRARGQTAPDDDAAGDEANVSDAPTAEENDDADPQLR